MSKAPDTGPETGPDTSLPRVHEVHADPNTTAPAPADLPKGLQKPVEQKSPAQWAYERMILYIQNFEKQLDAEHGVAGILTVSDVLR